jgi:purine-nucleoside phosphorylase
VSKPSAYDDFRSACLAAAPEVFLVLGSGIGPLVERVKVAASLCFGDVPGLTSSTVQGHRGRFHLGRWAGRSVLVAEGRLHYFEGNSWETVVRPVRFAAELGVRSAILTNAAGGIRDDLEPGSLLPLRDQVEWNCPWPWRKLRGPSPYSSRLLAQMQTAGGVRLPGVYAAVPGPSYETPAEIRALRSVGADAVGMSTSREALVAVETGLECAAVSLITNRAAGLTEVAPNHEEVLARARAAADRLADLLGRVLAGRW